jgi:AraC family transcriptional activator of pobA
MEKLETFDAFHENKFRVINHQMQFNIIHHSDCLAGNPIQYRRRDFYKVSFLTGHYILHYGDKSLEVKGTALSFFKPDVPYTIDILEESTTGGYFIFREAYFNDYYRSNIRDLPLFANGNKPIFLLDATQEKTVADLFEKTHQESASDYEFKHDLIRNYVIELIHFAMKMRPSDIPSPHIDAKTRITGVFYELLDRQFPIESTTEEVSLRSASDFAEQLGVHVNYLNRAVRATTGKTTTEHISERLTSEAILLLKHSQWNIAEISYSLGFEDPSHFNHFFKKQTNQVPSSYR